MNPLPLPDPARLAEAGEWFAAGCFEVPDTPPLARWSRAWRRHLEHVPFPDYTGTALWCWLPAGASGLVRPHYSFTWDYNRSGLEAKLAAAGPEPAEALRRMDARLREEDARRWKQDTPHTCGGWNYTHGIPRYERVIGEGFDADETRIRSQRDARAAFYDPLLDLLAGIRSFHARLLAHLDSRQFQNEEQERNRLRLLDAYRQVPFRPARTFFEALACNTYVWMLDGGDNPGRLDLVLQPFYAREAVEGRLRRDEAVGLVREFFGHVSERYGWSTALGGRDAEGRPDYSDMTAICIEASHGLIRPSLELRVTPDMPQPLWDAALDALASGSGQPALYNEDAYLAALRDPRLGIRPEDLPWWNGGGCTETMIHGRSHVGSLEAGLHLPLILEAVLKQELPRATSFEAIRRAWRKALGETVQDVARQIDLQQRAAAEVRPQPMRTLLVDDCIDRGLEFNAGGARYNWSVVNVVGLSNIADSLAAVREMVFLKRELTGADLLAALEADFAGREDLRLRLLRCPKFGNDNPAVDELAAELAHEVFAELALYTPWRGGTLMPSCILFETYVHLGTLVGATPDGRKARQPLADSIGPVQGRDEHGPTAMLKSVARLPLAQAAGTPVLNLRLDPAMLRSTEGRRKARDLVRTYFGMGGLQVQITAQDARVLREAAEDPGKHPNLIVRIGGYSTWFRNLSPELKREVIARTEHGF